MFGADGTIDFTVASGGNNVFDGSGNYKMTVNAAGYTTPLEFTITAAQAEVTTTAAATESTTTTKTTTTAKKSTTTTKKAASTDSPKTGVAGTAIPVAMLALAGAAAVTFRKKND
jgi:LPXTG-motif cell wall-anchored protein